MPPLVWRESIAFCPVCWHETDSRSARCLYCNSEFNDPIEVERKIANKRLRMNLLKQSVALAAIFISISILFIYVNLPILHEKIQPIESQLPEYLLASGLFIAFALIFHKANSRKNLRNSNRIPLRQILPSTIIVISGISAMIFPFAKEIDLLLDRNGLIISGMMLSIFAVAIFIFLKSPAMGAKRNGKMNQNIR